MPPPTLCECRECTEDAPRSVQMHTGASSAVCPPLPVRACASGLTLFCCIYYIIVYKKVKHQSVPVLDSNWDLNMNFTLRADVFSHRLLGYLRISIPGRGIEPHSRVLTARMQSFSFVLRGEKSPLTGWLTFSTRKSDKGFSGPLSSSLILSHRRQQKSRAKFLFQRNFA